ncbi:MAG TPA: hypothetical protein VEA41_19675 [Salinarimonas sp.]|jgi:hypothetical protein|nr:hypothetical protein [Salinarimonas sp.]
MFCRFCERDVEIPCHTVQEVLQWAEHHIEPCEQALRMTRGGSVERSPPERGA